MPQTQASLHIQQVQQLNCQTASGSMRARSRLTRRRLLVVRRHRAKISAKVNLHVKAVLREMASKLKMQKRQIANLCKYTFIMYE